MISSFYKFRPLLKSVIWGGDRIKEFKGIDTHLQQVGESWEISGVAGHESVVTGGPDHGLTLTQLCQRHGAALLGESVCMRYGSRFPLLIKLIDAHRDLSVQVHPGDEMASRLHGCPGKTEMWCVIDHEPGAQIMAGFDRQLSPEEFDRRVADGAIMDVVAHHTAHAGDVFFLPAGCIHAIGAGNFIAEVQQASDVTYRVFDYNRRDRDGNPRQLHVEQARQALNFAPYADVIERSGAKICDGNTLVACHEFTVERHEVARTSTLVMPDSFLVVMCTGGSGRVTSDEGATATLRTGETILVPACHRQIIIEGSLTLLSAHC